MEALQWSTAYDAEILLPGAINLICGVIFCAGGLSARFLSRIRRDAGSKMNYRENSALVKILLFYVRYIRSERVRCLKIVSRLACSVRALRAFFFARKHAEIFGMDVFVNYVLPEIGGDLFHHLGRRYYLAKNLRLRERVDFLLSHYRFEERFFDKRYKENVYLKGGLVLWEDKVGGVEFQMRLVLADRYAAEGDLCMALMVDGARLHAISFSWIPDDLVEPKVGMFIGLNQGRWQKEHEYQTKFNVAYPHNSANFVCYSALQGLARAVGIRHIIAVSGKLQVCFCSDENRSFENAYDDFWKSVGGVLGVKHGFYLPVPWPKRDLSALPSKHRKRAATRRLLLDSVEGHTFNIMVRHLQHIRSRE